MGANDKNNINKINIESKGKYCQGKQPQGQPQIESKGHFFDDKNAGGDINKLGVESKGKFTDGKNNLESKGPFFESKDVESKGKYANKKKEEDIESHGNF